MKSFRTKKKERQCNNCLFQANLPHKFESATHATGKKKERLQKVAEHKANKHLLEFPKARGKCLTQTSVSKTVVKQNTRSLNAHGLSLCTLDYF